MSSPSSDLHQEILVNILELSNKKNVSYLEEKVIHMEEYRWPYYKSSKIILEFVDFPTQTPSL